MYKQISPKASLIILLSAIILPVQVAAKTGLTVTAINSARAYPVEITYSTTSDGFEVRGAVRSRFHNGRIRGHVDLSFTDANGQTLNSGSSKLRRINASNKHQHRVAFKALFNELPAGAATLQVTHHIGTEGH
ncbi:MAG: hypothetical protein L3J28_13370 [Candidatus Polarisedimenticolaceae bacterium]|nr:hypothetical protein [Candidatus Polarisedimenticolaceae bacterium]